MAQFWTLSFTTPGLSEERAERLTDRVKEFLIDQGAKEVLMTHSGEPDEEADEEAERPRSRRR